MRTIDPSVKLALEFNDAVKDLADKAASKGNVTMMGYKQQLYIVAKASPLQLIENSAKDIWKYRRVILAIHEDDTYNWDLVSQFKSSYKANGEQSIIDLIYDIFRAADEAEKICVYENVLNILSIVKKYRDLSKAMKSSQ